MFVLFRLYAFYRRCGRTRRHALSSAVRAVLIDFNINRSTR